MTEPASPFPLDLESPPSGECKLHSVVGLRCWSGRSDSSNTTSPPLPLLRAVLASLAVPELSLVPYPVTELRLTALSVRIINKHAIASSLERLSHRFLLHWSSPARAFPPQSSPAQLLIFLSVPSILFLRSWSVRVCVLSPSSSEALRAALRLRMQAVGGGEG